MKSFCQNQKCLLTTNQLIITQSNVFVCSKFSQFCSMIGFDFGLVHFCCDLKQSHLLFLLVMLNHTTHHSPMTFVCCWGLCLRFGYWGVLSKMLMNSQRMQNPSGHSRRTINNFYTSIEIPLNGIISIGRTFALVFTCHVVLGWHCASLTIVGAFELPTDTSFAARFMPSFLCNSTLELIAPFNRHNIAPHFSWVLSSITTHCNMF